MPIDITYVLGIIWTVHYNTPHVYPHTCTCTHMHTCAITLADVLTCTQTLDDGSGHFDMFQLF